MKIILFSVLAIAIFGVMAPSVNAVHTMEHEQAQQSILDRCNDYPHSCVMDDEYNEILFEFEAKAEKERLEKEQEKIKKIKEQKQAEENLFKGVLWVVFILSLIVVGFCVVALIARRRSKYYNYYKK